MPLSLAAVLKLLLTALLVALFCRPITAHSEPPADTFSGVDHIVAIGDVHGAYQSLLELLQGNGLIDAKQQWTGGKSHLVSVGDLLDRGSSVRPVLDLFMALQPQAQAAGGRVHVLLGNHELMNLLGDWRDVAPADLASFAQGSTDTARSKRHEAFSANGSYGRWLLQQPVIIKINDLLFSHGGLPSLLSQGTLSEHNQQARSALAALLENARTLTEQGLLAPHTNLLAWAELEPQAEEAPALTALRTSLQSPFWGDLGPLWYRGSSLCHGLVEADLTEAVLAHLDANAVVVGHTPTWNHWVRRRLGGQVWVIDTGMLNAVYRGQPLALEVRGDEYQVRDVNGKQLAFEDETFIPYDNARLQSDGARLLGATFEPVAQERGGVPIQVVNVVDQAGEVTGQATFSRLRKQAAGREVAAYVLDRLLGIGMVPLTVTTELNGQRGVLQWQQPRVISEQERLAQARSFPNWCERGDSYLVVGAFDALINQRQRTVANLGYSHRLTRIQLTDHSNAFGTSRTLPPSATQPVLSTTLRERLLGLTREVLDRHLGDYLSRREIAALLQRRDALLEWPALADS